MNKLLKAFKERFVLLVSITQNDLELARIARDCGADAFKVHINCAHFASGTNFGTWQEEKDKILEIRREIDLPMGIVTGAETVPGAEDLKEIRQAGFDFWDLFAHHTPPEYLGWEEMAHMTAVGPDWTPEQARSLESLGVDVIESSIIPRTNYRTRLTAADLCQYQRLAASVSIPIIVPTQKAVRPDEISWLKKTGVSGIAIGAVVTGLGTGKLGTVISSFRKAIDAL
ncbi:MAG: hypothetical protein K6G50_05565 [bacterium]|nr:hypothetical protein [bacterium]